MRGDVERVLISQDRIALRVHELARQITGDFRPTRGAGAREDSEITIVPILTGAMIFCADLIRHIPMAMKIGLLAVTSYPGRSVRTQGSRVIGEMLGDLRGRHVLLVDDILDSGGTVKLVSGMLKESGAAAVRTCVLLRKDRPSAGRSRWTTWGLRSPTSSSWATVSISTTIIEICRTSLPSRRT